MRTSDGDRIHRIIRQHVGAEDLISSAEICRELGWTENQSRQVRQIIADEAALWPDLVCAVSGKGYFLAASYEEAETYHNWLLELAAAAQLKLLTFRKLLQQHGLHVPLNRAAKELGVAE